MPPRRGLTLLRGDGWRKRRGCFVSGWRLGGTLRVKPKRIWGDGLLVLGFLCKITICMLTTLMCSCGVIIIELSISMETTPLGVAPERRLAQPETTEKLEMAMEWPNCHREAERY